MHKIINFFLPTKNNNYYPGIASSKSISIFAIFVFAFNIFLGNVAPTRSAEIIDTSEIIRLHNEERRSEGLPPLAENTLLNKSAQLKANAMLEANCWSHYCPEGKEPWDFFDQAGYIYVYAGENLAQGFYTEESAMTAWMNSPTHRDNVLKDNFSEIGIGVAYGEFQNNRDNVIITVHFGSRDYNSANIPNNNPDNFTSDKPVINYPREGDYINDSFQEISGFSQQGNEVEIINNEEILGRINTDGGTFKYRPLEEYREGQQNVEVKSYESGEFLESSDVRKFIVDTISPEINNDVLSAIGKVKSDDNKVIIEFESSESLRSAQIVNGSEKINFYDIGSNKWQGDVEERFLLENSYFEIELTDLAENKSLEGISIGQIAGLSTNESGLEIQNSDNVFTSFTENFTQQSLQVRMNMFLVGLVMIIITADLIALKKTGMTGLKGKHHLHLGNFAVLLVVILLGGFGGVILEGINK